MAAAFATLALGFYQQCGVGGESGFSNLGSSGQSPNGSPTISFDVASVTLPNAATSMNLSGVCNQGNFANYVFEASYRTGANSPVSRRYPNAFCTSGRFSFIVPFSDLSIVAGSAGQLTLAIIGITTSGEILGPQTFQSVGWTSGGTTSSTTGGTTSSTTGGTTSSTTGGTTGSTTGCSPSCDSNRACGSTLDSCGTHTCSPGTNGCCTPSCDPNRGCGSQQDTCGGQTCSPKRCASCNQWQSGRRVNSMSDHRVHENMNTLTACQADCQSYENVNCCQYDSNAKICYVVLSGDCGQSGAGAEMSATICN